MDEYVQSLLHQQTERAMKTRMSIKLLAKLVRTRVRKDYDVVIAVTGDEGSGKSTLGIKLAFAMDDDFKIEKNVLFSPVENEVKEAVTGLPKYSAIVLDEAIKVMYKLNWNTKIQKLLNILYALARKENKITLLCIPRFTDLTEFFRNHRVHIWVHVTMRGYAFVFIRDKNPFTDDPWHFKNMQKRIARTNWSSLDIKGQIKVIKRMNSYAGVLRFHDFSPRIKEKYLQMRDAEGEKYKGLEMSDPTDMYKEKIEQYKGLFEKGVLVMRKTGLSIKEIASLMGKTRHTISYILKKKKDDLEEIEMPISKKGKTKHAVKKQMDEFNILSQMKNELKTEEVANNL